MKRVHTSLLLWKLPIPTDTRFSVGCSKRTEYLSGAVSGMRNAKPFKGGSFSDGCHVSETYEMMQMDFF